MVDARGVPQACCANSRGAAGEGAAGGEDDAKRAGGARKLRETWQGALRGLMGAMLSRDDVGEGGGDDEEEGGVVPGKADQRVAFDELLAEMRARMRRRRPPPPRCAAAACRRRRRRARRCAAAAVRRRRRLARRRGRGEGAQAEAEVAAEEEGGEEDGEGEGGERRGKHKKSKKSEFFHSHAARSRLEIGARCFGLTRWRATLDGSPSMTACDNEDSAVHRGERRPSTPTVRCELPAWPPPLPPAGQLLLQ